MRLPSQQLPQKKTQWATLKLKISVLERGKIVERINTFHVQDIGGGDTIISYEMIPEADEHP